MATRGISYEEVRRISRGFPGIEESTSYGTPALKVQGKLLTRLKEDGKTLVVRTTFIDRDLLIQSDPSVYFFTDHYRNYPYVLVRLELAELDDLRERLEDAWRRSASKKVLAAYDARAPHAPGKRSVRTRKG